MLAHKFNRLLPVNHYGARLDCQRSPPHADIVVRYAPILEPAPFCAYLIGHAVQFLCSVGHHMAQLHLAENMLHVVNVDWHIPDSTRYGTPIH